MRAVLPLIAVALLAVVGWYRATVVEDRLAKVERLLTAGGDGKEGGALGALTQRVDALDTSLRAATESLFNQATDVSQLKQERERLQKARLDLEDKKFSRIETQLGPLFVQAEAVHRRPDDTVVDLLIGNPTSATLLETALHVRWGRAYDPSTDLQLWTDGLKEKDLTIKSALRPGAWTIYPLKLETGPVTQLGFLELSFDAKTVQLQEPVTTTTLAKPRPAPPSADGSVAPSDAPNPEEGQLLDDSRRPAAKPASAAPKPVAARPAAPKRVAPSSPTPPAKTPAPSTTGAAKPAAAKPPTSKPPAPKPAAPKPSATNGD